MWTVPVYSIYYWMDLTFKVPLLCLYLYADCGMNSEMID